MDFSLVLQRPSIKHSSVNQSLFIDQSIFHHVSFVHQSIMNRRRESQWRSWEGGGDGLYTGGCSEIIVVQCLGNLPPPQASFHLSIHPPARPDRRTAKALHEHPPPPSFSRLKDPYRQLSWLRLRQGEITCSMQQLLDVLKGGSGRMGGWKVEIGVLY